MLKDGCKGIRNKVKLTFHTLFSKRFSPLIMVIWYKAFLMAFYSGSLPRIAIKKMIGMTELQHNQQSQFIQVFVSVGAVVGGFGFGRLFPKLKNKYNVIISVLVGMLCIIAITLLYSMESYVNYLWYITGFLFGNGECTGYTIIIAILSYEFKSDTEQFGAYAVMRGFGTFFGYYMSSLMVENYTYELIGLFAVLAICALVVSQFFEYTYDKKTTDGNALVTDNDETEK